jgi:hypothetical protein
MVAINWQSDDTLAFDERSTKFNRNRDVSCKIPNNCYMHAAIACSQFSTPNSRDILISALSFLDLSITKKPIESEFATPDTTYSKNLDIESGRKLEQRSSLVQIWCEGPAKSIL